MLSSKQILDLITNGPGTPGFAGRLEGLRRFDLGKNAMGYPTGSDSNRRLIADLQAMAADVGTIQREKYLHPEDDQRAHQLAAQNRAGMSQEFSPSDLAWISRLPSDPTQVSYDDAVALAGLAKASHTFADRSGARLIESVWRPVKEQHDAQAAEVALRNAKAAPVPLPASTVHALADALAVEYPELDSDEATSRARKLLDQAMAQREAAQTYEIADAQAAIAQAEQSTRDRTAITKPAATHKGVGVL